MASSDSCFIHDVWPLCSHLVLEYLNALDLYRCRQVCTTWRRRLLHNGIALLQWEIPLEYDGSTTRRRQSSPDAPRRLRVPNLPGRLTIHGHSHTTAAAAASSASSSLTTQQQQPKRARGHLPEPAVLHSSFRDERVLCWMHRTVRDLANPAHVVKPGVLLQKRDETSVGGHAQQRGLVVQLETPNRHHRHHGSDNLATMDLCVSMLQFSSVVPRPPRANLVWRKHDLSTYSKRLKTILKILDVASLCHLRQISVRGLTTLRVLCLPPTLLSLDAQSCTQLHTVTIPTTSGDQSNGCSQLVAANLNGCRVLQNFPSVPQLRHLNASSVGALLLPSSSLAHALVSSCGGSRTLTVLSLRYVATDEVLQILATQQQHGLQMLDVSFSPAVTHSAVQVLVEHCGALERCHLRGCRQVPFSVQRKIYAVLRDRAAAHRTIGAGR